MRSNDIFDVIGYADYKYVAAAKQKQRIKPKIFIISAAALILALSVALGALIIPNIAEPTDDPLSPYALSIAKYPLMARYISSNEEMAGIEWENGRLAQKAAFYELSELPYDFIEKAVKQFLPDANGENLAFSPLNIYMTLAMLAETAEGNSRDQILSLLGTESIEELRRTAKAIWNAHFCDDGALTSILASSVWLDDDLSYNGSTLASLADNYYTSSFSGDMGSDEYNSALHAWLDEQTDGLLSDQSEGLAMTPETICAIASTVYFSAKWNNEFDSNKNDQKTFHGTNGDELAEFMNTDCLDLYYWGDTFSAVCRSFDMGGGMYFILPDEGVSTEELFSDREVISLFLGNQESVRSKYVKIDLSIPKFDVSSNIGLESGLKELGVTDVFDPEVSDLSALSDIPGIFVSDADHAVRVKIDEEGCTAAAYTVIREAGSAAPQDTVDFTLDRPFMFVIISEVGLPLFCGTVNQIK